MSNPGKGSIGKHGDCKVCLRKFHRRHNKLWCFNCLQAYDLKRNPEGEGKKEGNV